jgi:hypothetical protein
MEGFYEKKSIIWMIALVSVSLFFWGCPTEAEDDKETFTDVPTVTASRPERIRMSALIKTPLA